MSVAFEEIRTWPPGRARQAIRAAEYTRHTAGLAPGRLQANLVILPQAHAEDFARFCVLNPRPCPVVGRTPPGDPILRGLGADLDLRTDVPSYNIYRDGALGTQTSDLQDLWRDDLVGFALGCSFTFENALLRAGLELWHIARNTTVPMYKTTLPLTPAGPFSGTMVVSMRALPKGDVARATEVSARFPWAHGGPVHTGDASEIGIADLAAPDWGDPAPVPPGHVPCFWACGVTPQNVVRHAGLPLVITHTPGCMLITDLADDVDPRATAQPSPNLKPQNTKTQQGDFA
ncbi:MAG: putative hydro-lyase [Pseudomonadota bacterium]